jgi:protein TonB
VVRIAPPAGGGGQWRSALAVSVALHAVVAGLLFVGIRHTAVAPAEAPAAMAVQLLADPGAPPQPVHQTPVEPQHRETVPQEVARPVEKLPPLPEVAKASPDAVVQPKSAPVLPKQEQRETQKPAPPSAPPSAPPMPPRPVAAAPVQGASLGTARNAEQTWEGLVLAKLERKKRYPWEAQRAGQQDTVYVRVTMDRSGNVLDGAIDHSKHFAMLDRAVLDLVRRSSPLPAPPASVPGDTVSFVVPVDFFIKSGR